MKKIETCAPAELARMLPKALEEAGVLVPLSITPTSGIPEPSGASAAKTADRHSYCKCELIVPDSLADHVVEVVAHLLRDTRFTGLFSRLVILEIDENYQVGSTPNGELVSPPLQTQRRRRLNASKKNLTQPG